jgi:hypothetical protein
MKLEVTVPDILRWAVIGDISSVGEKILGTEKEIK